MSNATGFVDFLNASHSAFHAIDEVETSLRNIGFIRLKENAAWTLENNRYYYVVRNQSSLIAFKIPEMINVKSINVVASHSDSPVLKLKPIAHLTSSEYTKLNVEVYGGTILSTWMDKPLSLAGRVTVKETGTLVNRLFDYGQPVAIIPNVAIHQNRTINDGYKYNPQVDMIPIVALQQDSDYINDLIAKKLEINKEDIFGFDLELYNTQQACLWGSTQEFISGQRIDNLESVYTSLQAFKVGFSKSSIDMLAIFDNEEVGAISKQGMAGSFLRDIIDRIFLSFFYTSADIKVVLANSFMLSADNAHAVHPNHPELYDSTNQTYMNKGVVVKTTAGPSYISDSMSSAVVKQLAFRSDVPLQYFSNRSDVKGGGTQASIGSINVSIMGADIGLAQLAMHSSYETCGSKDIDHMIRLLTEFYNSSIIIDDNKVTVNK